MQDYSQPAIAAVSSASIAYCKFIKPNDTGATGAHQSGYYIHKEARKLMFTDNEIQAANPKKEVTITWQDDFETSSVFTYYNQESRNEFRLTRFGHGFPFLKEESIGSLLVISRLNESQYSAYVLSTEEQIEKFLDFFGIPATNANGIVRQLAATPDNIEPLIQDYIRSLPNDSRFPSGSSLASAARNIHAQVTQLQESAAVDDPDTLITGWIDTEFSLFREVERNRYQHYLAAPFPDIDTLIETANTILNRRKSRAGRSLESHLARIFELNQLRYTQQGRTEGSKKPDFIMPSIDHYHDNDYDAGKLVFLGVKTTCKDRWRQILNEADRTPRKYLFTLQQGISPNQLQEMKTENVTLVVPESHMDTFPASCRQDILTLKQFLALAKQTTA